MDIPKNPILAAIFCVIIGEILYLMNKHQNKKIKEKIEIESKRKIQEQNRQELKVLIKDDKWICPACKAPNNKLNDICAGCGQPVIKE